MIDLINLWFKRAVPEPTDKNRAVQYGVHLEEINEMIEEGVANSDLEVSDLVKAEANYYKNTPGATLEIANRELFLDSLCDQIVTAVGVAYMNGFDIVGALQEVNRSNWSKFENGEPLFDENGKIKKGPNYSPPDLSKFV